ncbi:recombinase family protein [Cellulomonas sp. HD19AZ1]|uniref:recombinase family protein n=1 Tax=Cellulomonas sp. HD19AZ1 TaxID=2559593 RepID=UPI00107097DD|nr:recombinase family protein [Cellulomonas sp. HD19AZ1]TFH74444.1 recombinase family protein [Cellulomonas sp. HD19AZ1]
MAQLGYARVSTRDQDPTRQHDDLAAVGCDRVWTDAGVSGTTTSRPQLDALLDYARDGDTIVVTELSRLGRTVRQLVVLVDDLGARGIGVRSLTQAIDTTPGQGGGIGTLLLSLFAALAQLEREVLVDRTMSDLAAARARGRVGGRPTVLPPDKLAAAHALLAAGTPKTEVAAALGVSRSTVYRAIERERVAMTAGVR